jgi:penicillin-binding protein 1A
MSRAGLRIFGLALCAVLVLVAGTGSVLGGRSLLAAGAGLSGASALEDAFGLPGSERFRPALLFDRSGEVLLAEVTHPLAAERRWQRVSGLPQAVTQATIAALDPTFWQNPGYVPSSATARLWQAVLGRSGAEAERTITERLAALTFTEASSAASLASLALAADIAAAYPKERVLEWFLNSADSGNLAVGIDAAALVYFGKHAEDLTSLRPPSWPVCRAVRRSTR